MNTENIEKYYLSPFTVLFVFHDFSITQKFCLLLQSLNLNLTRLRRGLVIPAQAGIHEPPNSVWITEILDPGLRRGDTL